MKRLLIVSLIIVMLLSACNRMQDGDNSNADKNGETPHPSGKIVITLGLLELSNADDLRREVVYFNII